MPRGIKRIEQCEVDIHTVRDLALRVVLHTITRAAGSQAPPEATKAQLLLAFECMNPTLFDWATAVTTNIKRQLTKCKKAKLKQFGYGVIHFGMITNFPGSRGNSH